MSKINYPIRYSYRHGIGHAYNPWIRVRILNQETLNFSGEWKNPSLETIDNRKNSEADNLELQLQSLIKIKSVSAKNQSLEECAILVSAIMNNTGMAEPQYLSEGKGDKSRPAPPFVFWSN